jgi:outer membrane protein assembly factor BamB
LVGVGHASPIVAGTTAYVFARDGEREVLRALDVGSGKEQWHSGYDAPYDMNPAARGHGKGPKSTPLFDRGRVFTLGISGVVSAHDALSGKVLWRKSLTGPLAGQPAFGAATSPVADESRVIVFMGTSNSGALTAFDAATGKEQWSWTGDGPAYATPAFATIGATRQIITQSQKAIVSVAAHDGRLLWRLPFTTPYEQNSVTPLVVGDRVIVSGMDQSTFAVRPEAKGSTWTVEKVWDAAAVPMYMSSPVAIGHRLFGFTHRQRGQLFSLDATTGKTLWTSPPRLGENAAIVALGQSLLVLIDSGELMVVAGSGDRYRVDRRYTVAESSTWAHPVPVASSGATIDGVLIKDERQLTLWTWAVR